MKRPAAAADDDARPSILQSGENCWRTAHADRVTFLVDGEAFFSAVADVLANAQHSVWLLGWDFHSSVLLRRPQTAESDELVALLDGLVRERHSLHVRVLAWDFAMLYALEREFLPLLQFGRRTHRRVHFAMDSAHPMGASQHQKLVVVDDAVAYAGGFDLTTHRWDTREHAPCEPRRVTPAGASYAPFHDVQIAVDGAAAAALAELARERWRRATGEQVRPESTEADPWPRALTPDLCDVDVGIARTLPSFRGSPEVREVETLYRDSIASARRWIYVENQYLTSPRITGWLAARLREADGPEVVIVGPRENAGWLEEGTMGALRDRAIRQLREADRRDGLRVLYPHVPGLPDGQMLNVHSKVMVVDDTFARVGSSNLSNRSLGLDTECDMALEARGRDDVRRAIAALRNDLLAEHLGVSSDRVAGEIERLGSLVGAVDALGGDGRTLRPIEIDVADRAADVLEALGAVDPEHPVPLEELVGRFGAESRPAPPSRRRHVLRLVMAVALLAAGALAWRVTPLGEWLTPERLAVPFALLRETWSGPIVAWAIFVGGSVLLVPVTALVVATGLALGPMAGIAVAWSGIIGAAALGHLAGRLLWRESVRRLAGERLNALSQRLGRRGVLSSALVRVVPVAPFMVVNLVAGASHVRARDFLLGTALGTLPGIVLLIVAADRIAALLRAPSGPAWLWAVLALAALAGSLTALRWFATRAERRQEQGA